MAYKLDGIKFQTLEELVEALYPIYKERDKMSEEEFKKYVEEHAEKS
jgi:hypothetical protein